MRERAWGFGMLEIEKQSERCGDLRFHQDSATLSG
jgi:hypothetical protein